MRRGACATPTDRVRNPLGCAPISGEAGSMTDSSTDRDDIKRPQDHLPPAEERGDEETVEAAHFPGVGEPDGGSPVSPATAAEPERPARHGAEKLPQSGG